MLWNLFDNLIVFIFLATVNVGVEEFAAESDSRLAIASTFESVPAAFLVVGVRIRVFSIDHFWSGAI